MNNYYLNAYKQGLKQYKKNIAQGENPYLPVLDEMIPQEKSIAGIDIGTIQVPTELIIGTKSVSRTNDFASNFMPIADEKTEFASKWESLCVSHVNEGIREPIIVWEYMNRYYVQEGNKRVSVLKFFDSVSILAQVKRVLPPVNEDTKLYYELLDFKKVTNVDFIEFSKSGSYKELQTLLGKETNEIWTEDEVKRFKSVYYSFKKCFIELGGNNLELTVADALLAYMQVYDYSSLRNLSEKQMLQTIQKAWREIQLQQEEKPIEVRLDPDKPKRSIIPTILLKKKKVAYIFGGPIESSGWRELHDKGMRQAQLALSDKIESEQYIVSESTEKTIQEAIQNGTSILFATEANMMKECLKFAVDYPNVKIYVCALNVPHRLIQTYYPRIYEAKFISGAIAGAMTKSNSIGYICKYPIYGAIAEINAFARGVQIVNPEAKVYLEWSTFQDSIETQKVLIDKGVDLITFREYGYKSENTFRRFGLAQVTKDSVAPLVLPLWNWGTYYQKIISSVIDGTSDKSEAQTQKSLNYYWGIKSGVVGMLYSERLPKGVRYLGELLYQSFKNGTCNPFFDPEKAPNENYIWEDVNKALSIEQIINMDWLEDNVIGTVPKYEQLDPMVQEVVNKMGVKSARKEAED